MTRLCNKNQVQDFRNWVRRIRKKDPLIRIIIIINVKSANFDSFLSDIGLVSLCDELHVLNHVKLSTIEDDFKELIYSEIQKSLLI
ncbi:hypothetical protein LCGC14_1453420 [marine sediment metagenome]|uniref:Uncharacterized protein n=1 Tax=marine sediment metagenome TaxID=412755 RepID=A0A0F9K3F6_9ZZZZ